jgi:hypothetical protein
MVIYNIENLIMVKERKPEKSAITMEDARDPQGLYGASLL